MYEHVPMYHFVVFVSTPSHTICALTSHHRVRCSSGLKHLAKHHSHETYMRRAKHSKKAVEGATALFVCKSRRLIVILLIFLSVSSVCLSVLSSWMIGVRDKISHVLTERAWVRGVGIDLTLQSCCSWCYVIQQIGRAHV